MYTSENSGTLLFQIVIYFFSVKKRGKPQLETMNLQEFLTPVILIKTLHACKETWSTCGKDHLLHLCCFASLI